MKESSDKSRKRVKLSVKADPKSNVFVAGSFNEWDPANHKCECDDGVHSISLMLVPGKYEYKFVINDVWCIDPECKEWAPNSFGSLNSVLVVE